MHTVARTSLLLLALVACQREGAREGGDTAAARAGSPGSAGSTTSPAAADSAFQRAVADSGSWPSFGRDHSNQRFSSLSQITAANVSGLQVAWTYKTGLPHAFEASPVRSRL